MTGVRAAIRFGFTLIGLGVVMFLLGRWDQDERIPWIAFLLSLAVFLFAIASARRAARATERADGCARLLTIAGGILLALLALTPLLAASR